jgi:hypothetical protein
MPEMQRPIIAYGGGFRKRESRGKRKGKAKGRKSE